MHPLSTYLYARPSFCGGAASAIDIGGTLIEYNYSQTTEEADAAATWMDWFFVGQDIAFACDEYARQHGREGGHGRPQRDRSERERVENSAP